MFNSQIKYIMKKISIFLIGSLLCLTVPFITSCDEDYPGPDPVEVTANYSNKFSNPNPNLSLTYNGMKMEGKAADFSTVKGETANITLYDIIPGEKALSLNSIPLTGDAEGYSFSGNGTGTTTGSTFTYEGRVTKGMLTINLSDIKIGNSELWSGHYLFANPVSAGEYLTAGAAYVDTEMAPGTENGYNTFLRGILCYFIPQLLHSVTLQEDGNIIAEYSQESILLMGKEPDVFMAEVSAMSFEELFSNPHLPFLFNLISGNLSQQDINLVINDRAYLSSPLNLAYWYKKDDRMMVKLNLAAVITQAMKSSGKIVDEQLLSTLSEALLKIDAIQLKNVLIMINKSLNNSIISYITQLDDRTFRTIFSWLAEGIPMNVKITEDGHTYLYLDKDTLQPILDLLPQIMPMISELLFSNMPASLATILKDSIDTLLNNFATDWPNSVRFNIGVDLTATNANNIN